MAMAKNLKFVGGSPLIGSPIVYSVVADTLKGEVSFHNVKIEVTAGIMPAADDRDVNKEYSVKIPFSTPANSGETVEIDISSALRAAADNYIYTFVPPSAYPVVIFSLRAWDEYLQNGEEHKTTAITNPGGTAIIGTYSDRERMMANGNKVARFFSRKPSSDISDLPEVVYKGESIVVPSSYDEDKTISNITAGQSSKVYDITFVEGVESEKRIIDGRQFYALNKKAPRHRYHFRFINSLGAMESFTAVSLPQEQTTYDYSAYSVSLQESFSKFSRRVTEVQNDHDKLPLTTSALDKPWATWVLHEFLITKHLWLLIDDSWIPCHVVLEDSVNGVDNQKKEGIFILFTVELDINGSPYASMMV